jgi:hypothetical protein
MKTVISEGFICGFKLLYVEHRLETRRERYGGVAAGD